MEDLPETSTATSFKELIKKLMFGDLPPEYSEEELRAAHEATDLAADKAWEIIGNPPLFATTTVLGVFMAILATAGIRC